ncbi:hypothetical protein OROMI_018962 [Orobanche minor]
MGAKADVCSSRRKEIVQFLLGHYLNGRPAQGKITEAAIKAEQQKQYLGGKEAQ